LDEWPQLSNKHIYKTVARKNKKLETDWTEENIQEEKSKELKTIKEQLSRTVMPITGPI